MSTITVKKGEKPAIPKGEYVVSVHCAHDVDTYITKEGKEPVPKPVEPRPGFGEEPKPKAKSKAKRK